MKILKSMTDRKILYIFTICMVVFLPILKQLSFYFVSYGLINNHDSINAEYVLYFSMPFLIYLYIKDLIKTKRELDIYDYLFYFLIFTGLLTSIFAMNTEISFLGKEYRHEGFLSLLSYYLLFITWKVKGKKEDIKKVINIFIVLGIINSIYSILQVYTDFRFILRYTPEPRMGSGICANPNFLGSLIVTLLGIITTKLLIDKKINIKNILLIVLFFISLINTQSTGPFLTYIITIIFLIIYLLIKKKLVLKNIIYLCIVLITTYLSIFLINTYAFKLDKCEMCDFTESIANNNDSSYTISNGRVTIWKESLELVLKNPFTGVGYDNYHLAEYENINLSAVTFVSMDGHIQAIKKYPVIVDNAHNVYLHTLITSGIFGLIPYLLLCLFTFIRGLKSKDNLCIMLLGGFVAYSIQAFANISVIQVAPIYYVIIGLILSIKQ